jgi:hypothetical protein
VADLFEEVEEQLRSDRYRVLARKALPWVLGIAAAALLAFLAYWGWKTYNERATHAASEQYQTAIEALAEGREAQAAQALTELSKSSSRAYKSLALMQLGSLRLRDNQPAEAAKLFDEAAKAAPDHVVGDAARLKSAFAVLDTAPYKATEERLTPLMEEGRPYRVQAREALGFAKLAAGDIAAARGDFVVITNSLDAPEGARARARAAIELIDSGSAKAVPGAIKAAAALPPMPTLPPGLVAGPQQPQATGPQ